MTTGCDVGWFFINCLVKNLIRDLVGLKLPERKRVLNRQKYSDRGGGEVREN